MHLLTFNEFRKKFPDAPTMTQKEKDKRSKNRKDAQGKITNTYKQQGRKVGFGDTESSRKAKETMVKDGLIDIENIDDVDNFNYMRTKEGREGCSEGNNVLWKGSPKTKLSRDRLSEALRGRPSKLEGRTYDDIHGPEKAKQINEAKSTLFRDRFINEDFQTLLKKYKVKLVEKEFGGAHEIHTWECIKCKEIFTNSWNAIQQGFECPVCYPRFMGDSKPEREMTEFVKSLNVEVIENTKKLIGKELDIVVPSQNFAIEHNGNYFHSTIFKSKTYHLEKTIACEKLGIRLLHIWGDEWFHKNELIKRTIMYTLGLSTSPRIHGRNCIIKLITDNEVVNKFLDEYHLQGKTIGDRIKLGAFYNDELVSIMTFRSNDEINFEKEWYLNRFCSNYNFIIPGIAGKLLSYFKNNYSWEKIITYAERRLSNGDLYRKLGFSFVHYTDINFWYTNGALTRHSRQFVISLMKKEDVEEGITQDQFMREKGYYKIYGCGNLKFELLNK